MLYPKFIGKYKIKKILGTGGFGYVYQGIHPKTKETMAIKVCQDTEILKKEYNILMHLQNAPEILRVHELITQHEESYMVMEPLGRSLSYEHRDKILSLECICAIGYQLLNIIEKIHSKDVIHRDIKPSQFLITLDKKSVKLVDFGMATFYRENGVHKEFKTRCKCRGTVSYASINNHLGFKQSRRDDLECLCYSLLYLSKGSLPWKLDSNIEGFKKWQLVLKQKINMNEAALFADLPPEFPALLKYTKKLAYDQAPNYTYMRSLLAKFINVNQIFYHFDWYQSSDKPVYVRKSQIVEGATVITKLRREKKVMKIREKKEKKMFQLRIASSVGTIDNNESEVDYRRKSGADIGSHLNLSGSRESFCGVFDKHKKSSVFLELPTYDNKDCLRMRMKKKKSRKTGKLGKVRSSFDFDCKILGDQESFCDDKKIQEYKEEDENEEKDEDDGDVTERYELPEFKNRINILQARDEYVIQNRTNDLQTGVEYIIKNTVCSSSKCRII